MACIGNPNRLAILLEILRGPKSVTALVEKCGFGSTDEHQKGFYVIQPHKVQGVIMLLTGISDMVDETFTKGTWNDAEEN